MAEASIEPPYASAASDISLEERLAVPYLNYYVCNAGVVVPVCGHEADADMLDLIASAYPDRAVVAVPGETLALGGGGPHCITQQIPAR